MAVRKPRSGGEDTFEGLRREHLLGLLHRGKPPVGRLHVVADRPEERGVRKEVEERGHHRLGAEERERDGQADEHVVRCREGARKDARMHPLDMADARDDAAQQEAGPDRDEGRRHRTHKRQESVVVKRLHDAREEVGGQGEKGHEARKQDAGALVVPAPCGRHVACAAENQQDDDAVEGQKKGFENHETRPAGEDLRDPSMVAPPSLCGIVIWF